MEETLKRPKNTISHTKQTIEPPKNKTKNTIVEKNHITYPYTKKNRAISKKTKFPQTYVNTEKGSSNRFDVLKGGTFKSEKKRSSCYFPKH